jgi:formylglycine-generating enzyme
MRYHLLTTALDYVIRCALIALAAMLIAALFFGVISDQAVAQERGNVDDSEKISADLRKAFVDCSDSCPIMKKLAAGKFLMGATDAQKKQFSLLPVEGLRMGSPREVEIEHAFAMSIFDITRKQFAVFVRKTGYRAPADCIGYNQNVWKTEMNWLHPGFEQSDNDPVVCVSWQDAEAYTHWLSKVTGKQYRLPTDAEWEYAARAGSTGSDYWDQQPSRACEYANVADKAYFKERGLDRQQPEFLCNDGYPSTSPVGAFKSNDFGLFDMLGDVSQMTQDCFALRFEKTTNEGRSSVIGDCRVRPYRGGSFQSPAKLETFWMSLPTPVSSRDNTTGFRVARDFP